MQKPIYLLFSGARQFLLFNCYRAREGNMLEEEKSPPLLFSPRARARPRNFPLCPKNRHLLATQAVKDLTF